MTCCEGWTSCNGFSLLVLLLLGIIVNAIPLGISLVEDNGKNIISCYEWWFPGIIGAGLMVIPATTMSLAARKRACCNHKTGMLLSSLLNVLTVAGALYCLLVSLRALLEGPLVCNSQGNSTVTCEFSFQNLTDFDSQSFNLKWFFSDNCASPTDSENASVNGVVVSNWRIPSSNSEEGRHRIFHFSVFMSLLLVGILELLFGLSQILIGLLGCLCGVSRRRGQIV